jgi:hypothetical protein
MEDFTMLDGGFKYVILKNFRKIKKNKFENLKLFKMMKNTNINTFLNQFNLFRK